MTKYVVESIVKGTMLGQEKSAVARVIVATEERARELVEDGARHGVVRTYRPIEA